MIGAVSAYVFFFFSVEKQKEKFIAERTARAEASARKEALSALMRTLDETKEERTDLFTRVLQEEDVIDLLALIETVGKEQGVVLTTNSLTVEPINATFESLVVSIDVEGPLTGVMHVLKLLEHLPYQSSVRNVQVLRNESEEGWKSTYDVRVTKYKKI